MQGSARIDELRQKFHENPRRYFAPLANEYRKAGDPEQAIAICRAHLAQQPGHMSGHVVYGQALYDAKRIDESRTVFEKALTLDPDNAIVLRYLGDIARQRGETAEAKHWYGRAFDADPNNSEIAAYIAELTEPLTEAASEVATSEASDAEAAAATAPQAIELVDASAADSTASDAVEEEVVIEKAQSTADRDELVESTVRDALDVSDTVADEEVSAPADVEVSETVSAEESSEQPADAAASSEQDRARSDTPVATPIVPLADVSWRKTPPSEDSPFVTRTMAELYAKQGYKAAALDVYKQLSLINPDDQEIFARIRELSGDEGMSRDVEAEVESSPVAELADAEAGPREESEPASFADDVPSEIAAESSAEAEPGSGAAIPLIDESLAVPSRVEELAAAAPPDWTDVSEEPVYTPAVEEIEPEPKPSTDSSDRHFTELDLAAGDTWDTDTWGAGFSADESTDLELDIPDTPFVNLSSSGGQASSNDAAPPSETAARAPEVPASQEAAPEPTGTAAPTDWERAAEAAEPSPAQAEPAAAEAEPAVAEAEPAVAEAEPAVAEAEPAVAEAEPAVAEAVQPAAEAEQPAAEAERVSAEVESAQAESAPLAEEKEPPSAEVEPAPEQAEPAVAEEARSPNEDFVEAERFAAAESEPAAVAEPDLEAEPEREAEPELEAEPAREDASEREAEPEREDEPHLVAYSPQPPADEDLPHYEPKGPTVREFFATLGARRPPSGESAQSFTARAAVPSHENPSDYPLAARAFADLFPDSPIAEEDTRAAFALSGAMSGTPAGAENPSAAETRRNTPPTPAAPVDNNQESEEDIRRFREWLDGLAES